MKLTFEATDVNDLISQVENFLGPRRLLDAPPKLETPTPPKFTAVPAAEPAAAPAELPQEKRRPGRPRKEPVSEPEDELKAAEKSWEEGAAKAKAEEAQMVGISEDPPQAEPVVDTVALHKLKEETLKRLRDLYLSGKGTFVRELLAKHGHGALVFPEVEARYFPEIKADMERGMH